MNLSSVGGNVSSSVNTRDNFIAAVTKNLIVVALCISINYINATMIHTFNKHQIFNVNPRYILFIHLVTNDVMQLFLSCLLHVISYAFHTINVSFCCLLLMVAVITTLNTPLNLAGMALECYVAICIPLRYPQICTVKRTYILIGWIWISSAISILPDLFLLLATKPLEFFHSRIFCIREYVFRSAYSRKKRDISNILCLVFVWLTLFYTYFRILVAAKAANADAKKARNTILLHGFQLLLCMLTYVAPIFLKALLYLFPKKYSDSLFACYIIIHIIPRFISPIVYGLRDKTFRRYLKRYLPCGFCGDIHKISSC